MLELQKGHPRFFIQTSLVFSNVNLYHLATFASFEKKYIQALNFPFQESKNPRSRDHKTSCGIE